MPWHRRQQCRQTGGWPGRRHTHVVCKGHVGKDVVTPKHKHGESALPGQGVPGLAGVPCAPACAFAPSVQVSRLAELWRMSIIVLTSYWARSTALQAVMSLLAGVAVSGAGNCALRVGCGQFADVSRLRVARSMPQTSYRTETVKKGL